MKILHRAGASLLVCLEESPQYDVGSYFQEIAVWSQNLFHVFPRGKKHTNHATVIVCRASANLGMVLAKSRMAHPAIEAAI